MGNTYRLAEHFISINGEGQLAGVLALFLRFAGCNLRCDWCDTAWACGKDAPHEIVSLSRIAQIAEDAAAQGVKTVTLTGGEPLLQEHIADVMKRLGEMGLRVEVETNGAVPLKPFLPCGACFTMDYKLPGSGMENHMNTANFALLNSHDSVKFVVGSEEDLNRAAEIIDRFKLIDRCHVYFSPVFGKIEPARIVEFMTERNLNGVRIQLQLHKFIWSPEKRGV